MRLFCELFSNYPILNHLTNLSSSFFDLLEAEQDGEEHQTSSTFIDKIKQEYVPRRLEAAEVRILG